MYISSMKSRHRHIDVLIIDLICLNIAFVLAYMIRIGGENPYGIALFRDMLIVLCLSDMLVVNLLSSYADIQIRGYYKEFVSLLKQSAIVFLLGIFFLYTVKDTHKFSRITLMLMGSFYFILNYFSRLVWKKIYSRRMKENPDRSLLVITEYDNAQRVIDNLESSEDFSFIISGIVLTDEQVHTTAIGKYPVVCKVNDVADYVCHNWVDEILIVEENADSMSDKTLKELSETGVIIHFGMHLVTDMLRQKQFVEKFGGYNVLTSCMNEASAPEIFLKRIFDICVGIVGCIVTGVIFIFITPVIKLKSPGPVFFKQKRVGKNGHVFYMIKFRSMHTDAEERKKEFVAANRVSDGMMFKLDFDPRIIGNEILPDGTKKTGIGEFIRKTSIDEFPQFYNVLKGDMSLVGTRPPTLDEWAKYEPHHRARLAIKPGITGMWQVSGRSKITDFEEVVALDTKYINEWSLGLDIKIILKTFAAVIKRNGAM